MASEAPVRGNRLAHDENYWPENMRVKAFKTLLFPQQVERTFAHVPTSIYLIKVLSKAPKFKSLGSENRLQIMCAIDEMHNSQ
eukprot:5950613-Pleurochrysis_carterae.AAC.1